MGLSSTRNQAATPATAITAPMIRKKVRQSPARASPSKPPKITSMESSGMIASTASTRPRLAGRVTSVTHAWNAASLAPEPRNDIRQSSAITASTVSRTTFATGAMPSSAPTVRKPNAAVQMPQSR